MRMKPTRREETVVAAEERMRSVVDHVVDGIITIDERGTVTTFNRAAERIFGYRAGDIIGQNVRLLMPEPYRGEHDGYVHNYLRTGQAKIIGIGREVTGQRRDGSTFPMELAISEFRLGESRYFTGIVRDITGRKRAEEELRRAEERMRSVVDHVIDGIITIDERGTIESFNPAAEKTFGYARAEVLGENVKLLMPEPYHDEHDGYIANYLATGQRRIIGIGREVLGRRKDGSTFPMELAVSEFHIGERRYFTGIVRDITERKRLESQLRERLAELAEADRQKNEFLAMLSHELRNPLAPMRNALYLIKRAHDSAEAMQTARDVMERQMHQLVRLVDDLLDVSRIIRGKIDLRRDRVDLGAVVNRALETAQPTLDAHGHLLELALPPCPVEVEGDLVRLSQVLSNLLVNAAKYSGRANRIVVALRADADTAVVSVRDYGVGISAELLPRVFDLFVQGENSLARSQGGLGIGLTLVKRLVEMHGGSVAARSKGLGQGSEFEVRLPLARGPATAATQQLSTQPKHTASRRARLLVVDDNVDAAETIAKILRLSGYEAHCAYDGPSALAAVRAAKPDVVVLDIGLPGMDGYAVARELRAQPAFRRTPLIAVTGYGQENDRQRSLQAGFDEHFTKPVDPEALQEFIGRFATPPSP
jgi:PAS domain S-box-containing protein